ncbi:hypothetical protein HK104_003508 [Borealophlyctis nickersoniae]|nr:hypothetical protein HK104_003508 [Borealophlyctis nickersoniae]
MSYKGYGDQSHNVQLLFEHDKKRAPMIVVEEGEVAEREVKKGHIFEYLVIYVHFVVRLVKRLSAKGFHLKLAPLDVAEVKMCILEDPNGLEVRLMELTDSQLNEASTKKQWYARLGYYTLPTHRADDSIRFYETLFSAQRGRSVSGKKVTTLDLVGRGHAARNDMGAVVPATPGRKKPGAAATLRQAINQGQGFRLVDTEDFIVGLSHTVYHWLGNDLRAVTCTLCFTERSNADSSTSSPPLDRSGSPLIAFGFEVPNTEACLNQMRYDHRDDIEWVKERYKIDGFGTICRFHDLINGLFLEVFANKTEAQRTATRDNPASTLSDAARASDTSTGPRYAVDFNHLKGHARTLSEGAVYRVRDPDDIDFGPPPEAKKPEKDIPPVNTLKAPRMHRVSVASLEGSESDSDSGESLNLSGDMFETEVVDANGSGKGRGKRLPPVKLKKNRFGIDRPKAGSTLW